MSIGIAVCAASERAEAELKDCFAALDIPTFVGVFSAENISMDTDKLQSFDTEFVDELRKIGKAILLHCRKRSTTGGESELELEARCERDALGYSGLAGLMATMFNVPTSTITALWCPGIYNREPWAPLFLRRGYLKHLVLA